MQSLSFIPYVNELKEIIHNTAPITDKAVDEMLLNVDINFTQLKRGTIIQEDNAYSKNIIIIKHGILRNYVYDEGKELTRWFAIKGDIVTSLLSWEKGRAASYIQASTKSDVWMVPVAQAKKIIEKSQEWRDWLLKMLIVGFGVVESRDKLLISSDAYTRFKNFYIARPSDIINQIPLGSLASYLRITQQTLCRFRRRLFKELKNR